MDKGIKSAIRNILRPVYRLSKRIVGMVLAFHHDRIVWKKIRSQKDVGPFPLGSRVYTHLRSDDPIFTRMFRHLDMVFVDSPKDADVVLIWNVSYLPLKYWAVLQSIRYDLPLYVFEDGFIRSVDIAANGDDGLSVLADPHGVYFSIDDGGLIANFLSSHETVDEEIRQKSRHAMDYILAKSVSKYNLSLPHTFRLPENLPRPISLVIDQRKGDQSIRYARATAASFEKMIADAVTENLHGTVIVKTHPDANSGKFSGYYVGYKPDRKNVFLLTDNVNAIDLLRQVDSVYVVGSQMGFEALMLRKDVKCYGAPFYSGWGITDDRGYKRVNGKQRTLEEVFYAAYIKYMFYHSKEQDPFRALQDVVDKIDRERAQRIGVGA